jgi:RNA polymerase sigma-70 factor (ECF subfamily)
LHPWDASGRLGRSPPELCYGLEVSERDASDGAENESDLVARLRAGDDTAYAELVRTQGGRMFAVARRLLRSDDDAADAVQEAFVSAFRAIASFEGGARLSTWLHRIVVNAALMKLRTRARRPEVSIEELLPKFFEDGHHVDEPAEWRNPVQLDAMERQETRTLVREQIDQLPADYRTVLLLRDIEGLDTKETAEVLGVTPNAAKIRLHRARLALRTLLDPFMRSRGTV